MNTKYYSYPALMFILAGSAAVDAETYEVGQKNKAFTESSMAIKVGDTVKFTNNDPFFHNVFSLSDAKFFDLGSYPQGESKDVTFEDAGTIDVECAIHPEMIMTIEVK